MTSSQRSPAEVRAEWQKRRTRFWVAIGVLLCVPLILLLVDFLIEPTPEKPGLPTPLYWFFTFGSMVAYLVFLQRNGRCPVCGKEPGGKGQSLWRIKNCQNCGAQLRD